MLQLKLMSFNIQHGKGLDGNVDLTRTAALIKGFQADVVALQEVDRFVPRSGFRDQARRLAQELNMHWCYAPSLKLGFIEYGNMILSRHPIVSRRTIYMRGFGERRTVLAAELHVKGHRVDVVNTHLGLFPWQREKQMPILLRTLQAFDGPTVLLGDFNMESDHKLLTPLARYWHKMCPNIRTATNRHGGEIDHIYTNMPVQQSLTWVEPTTASDHHPVLADIRFHHGTLDIAEAPISQAVN